MKKSILVNGFSLSLSFLFLNYLWKPGPELFLGNLDELAPWCGGSPLLDALVGRNVVLPHRPAAPKADVGATPSGGI